MDGYGQTMGEYVLGDSLGSGARILEQGKRVPVGAYHYPASGAVLWSDGKEMVVADDDAHTLIVSSTGGGKTESQVKPMMVSAIRRGESLLVTDTKSGELYELAFPYLLEQGYRRVYVLNFAQPHRSHRWNPLCLPAQLLRSEDYVERDMGEGMLSDFLAFAYGQTSKNADPFWDEAAKDIFTSHFHFLVRYAQPEQIHLASIARMHCEAKENQGELYARAFSPRYIEPGSVAANAAATRVSAPKSGTAPSMDAVFLSKINKLISSEAQQRMLCANDIDFMSLDEEKVAIFLLMPDSTRAWDLQASLFVQQVYQQLCRLCTLRHNGRLPHRFNLIFEEFGNLSLGDTAGNMFATARSRNIRLTAVIQNFGQLVYRYGQELADTIRYNTPNWIYMHTRELDTLETFSKLCGSRTYPVNGAMVTRPVASTVQLQSLAVGQALVLYGRNLPFVTDLAPFSRYETGVRQLPVVYPSNPDRKAPLFSYEAFFRSRDGQHINRRVRPA